MSTQISLLSAAVFWYRQMYRLTLSASASPSGHLLIGVVSLAANNALTLPACLSHRANKPRFFARGDCCLCWTNLPWARHGCPYLGSQATALQHRHFVRCARFLLGLHHQSSVVRRSCITALSLQLFISVDATAENRVVMAQTTDATTCFFFFFFFFGEMQMYTRTWWAQSWRVSVLPREGIGC